MNTTTNLVPVVHVKDGKVFANSRDVADFFGKRHADVLRDINVIRQATDADLRWFTHAPYEDAKGELRAAYDMTRDGFTLLVMGYTGPKAMEFKVRYIQQFNTMDPV
ncbi:MAG: Rha family transcriptional regulator [Methanobacterium sp.]|nr:Rha family transcriptional regulator [Methanobacterium sp.]